ncbi:MAG: 1-acyl-sn-glycerol-3-phosphate acyltransferase [Myxococcales bacterium]|nr:1-acyl-sn-glycerol-3-phosphate acyltransferase [Myxococcales bacterium]
MQRADPPALDRSVDPLSAMTSRFGFAFRVFAKRFFRHLDLESDCVERLRDLEARGAVVYVMRYASRLDYFLFNVLFLRKGLRLSGFANGLRFWYYRPLLDALKTYRRNPHGVAQDVDLVRAREYTRSLTREGASFFLFLRTASLRSQLRGLRGALETGRGERDLLSEVVLAAGEQGRDVHLVPLALFWRRGPRARRRFFNLSYGALTRPSDLSKVTSFLTTYRGLHVKVGDAVDVRGFLSTHAGTETVAAARTLRRVILSFLYREERVVEGPVLQPRHRVQEVVLRDALVREAIRQRAEERGGGVERAKLTAEKMFREISANMSSTALAALDFVVGGLIRRLFSTVEVAGIEKVTEYAKRNPLVLVPSHRSYFDFMILSILFYRRHIIPPHIAARENMAFGPFGFVFRRAGAFFLRRSFDDPLYKTVFRSYVSYLIQQGFTQEFFIEGGRSRTGKALVPRLGMLSWDVEAFLASDRSDLFFVPIAITYEKLVEEGAMLGELEGETKQEESVIGLVRARKYLSRRFGSVFVNFGEPLSLAAALGDQREDFEEPRTPEAQARLRDFVERLGNRIVERINWAMVPSTTAVGACVLLGERSRGSFREDFTRRMEQILDLLRLQDVPLTPELARDAGDFRESVASLQRMDLLRVVRDPRGEILYFESARRRALDLYRNSILHYLVVPSFLARFMLTGIAQKDLQPSLARWLDLFYREFFTSRAEALAIHSHAFLDHFERMGWLEEVGGEVRSTQAARSDFEFLAAQTRSVAEAYYAAFSAVRTLEEPLSAKQIGQAAGEQFTRSTLLGEVELGEAANPVTFGNALEVLLERGILARVDSQERLARYGRGEHWGELESLHALLAAALGAR